MTVIVSSILDESQKVFFFYLGVEDELLLHCTVMVGQPVVNAPYPYRVRHDLSSNLEKSPKFDGTVDICCCRLILLHLDVVQLGGEVECALNPCLTVVVLEVCP